ncbi:MAG TPA: SDR family oxidoreductase [Flavilitoribacter sp.]|nr:SDR family oxidoreductase [Flavilitoribacter sp.]
MDFKNKVVWITGASSGIGEYLAYAFAEKGARLILSARNAQELERVKNQCADPGSVMTLPLDVADFNRIPGAADEAVARFGRLDLLINNAGISQRDSAMNTGLDVVRKIMDVNFTGTVAVTHEVLPHMLAQKSGQIVVMSSVMGKFGTPWRSSYSASKHALQGYFDSLRAELVEAGIPVTIICPGFVRTNVTINALRGDGTPNNVMADTTANGIPPDVFAQKVLRTIAAKKEEAYIGGFREVLGVYLKRWLPGGFSQMIARGKVK